MTGQLRQEVFERAAMTEKPAGLPHSWIWREENVSLYLSSLPLSLLLSLASGYLEFPPYFFWK
jgi:hypothetical protein